jgi:tachylectin
MTMIHLLYTGNGTTPVDSGLPDVGRIFGIPTNGDLNWYRYLGNGEPDRSGARGWLPNSGNPIGNGWQNFLHVLGAGNGVVLAVQPDGDLRWYQYLGDGRADRSGATGWHVNSGNTIGNGWQGFVHLFILPQQGREGTGRITLFGVEPNGDLRWYQYLGHGENDRSGATGWHPNSRNIVGNGWAGFQRIVASHDIYAVQPDGALRWYSYRGTGVADRSGATGWDAKSGNQIGRGWQNFRRLTAGTTDSNGFSTVLYAVAQNGDLLWYRYNGHGENDPTGGTGWDARSGNPIGNGW